VKNLLTTHTAGNRFAAITIAQNNKKQSRARSPLVHYIKQTTFAKN
jgi:hypothetical protein